MQESVFFLSRPIPDRAFLTGLEPEFITLVLFPKLVKKQSKTKRCLRLLQLANCTTTDMHCHTSLWVFQFPDIHQNMHKHKNKSAIYIHSTRKRMFDFLRLSGIFAHVLTLTEDL